MKYSQPEKMEIIRMVEDSNLSVRRTLRQLDIPRSSFYEWYKRYQEEGYEGLASQHRTPHQFWNAIPEWERQRVVEVAVPIPIPAMMDPEARVPSYRPVPVTH